MLSVYINYINNNSVYSMISFECFCECWIRSHNASIHRMKRLSKCATHWNDFICETRFETGYKHIFTGYTLRIQINSFGVNVIHLEGRSKAWLFWKLKSLLWPVEWSSRTVPIEFNGKSINTVPEFICFPNLPLRPRPAFVPGQCGKSIGTNVIAKFYLMNATR